VDRGRCFLRSDRPYRAYLRVWPTYLADHFWHEASVEPAEVIPQPLRSSMRLPISSAMSRTLRFCR
jgi:hypothetical protein